MTGMEKKGRTGEIGKMIGCVLLCSLSCMMGCAKQGMKGTDDTPPIAVQGEISQEQDKEGQNSRAQDADLEDARKTLSILGDSISTFDDWIPEGYYDFYPMNGEVAYVNQTWWKMVLHDMDMQLCVNGSSSGSTCIGDSSGTDNPQYGCSDFRIEDLVGKDGAYPDIIIVYMGTNDFLDAVPLGSNDGTQCVEEGDIDNFSDAYCLMLDKLAAYYPNAEIFCCSLTPVGKEDTENSFVVYTNALGLSSEDYSRQIETIAAAKGCAVIDLQHCGITMDNIRQYLSDRVHLNPEGMKLVRDAVEAAISD